MNKYTLYEGSYDIVATGNNKRKLIEKCRKMEVRATVYDEYAGEIIYENKAQREENNR